MLDFIRIGCAVPEVRVGDVAKNAQDICRFMEQADAENADLLVFPELALTGYTCGDLFFQDALWEGVKAGLRQIVEASASYPRLTAVFGLPVRLGMFLFNCAAVVSNGKLLGLTPKSYIPNYNEFNEKRWFSPAEDMPECMLEVSLLGLEGDAIYLEKQPLFSLGDHTVMGVEICEDLWTAQPPSEAMALRGAEIIVNLSASNESAGKRAYRRGLVKHQSAACGCVYVYCSSGCTESTSDLVFSGHSLIGEQGVILGENSKYIDTGYLLLRDCDLGRVRADRLRNKSFADAAGKQENRALLWDPEALPLRSDGSLYPVKKLPFVPENQEELFERCQEIFAIQVAGLKQRLALLGASPVIGVSGGLDSTLALLVAVKAMEELGRPASDVYGVTMPCFGTSDRTYRNALALMEKLGITVKEIPIRQAVAQHFGDIGHDPNIHNATYENAQARERTQVLMDYAGMVNGIVVGTGDLSELALGWCTYNGDHMSMYGVNASIPKTLIGPMIRQLSGEPLFACAREALLDVVDTPISPELLPPDAQGKIQQQTEDIVGPYALHDFFLFYMLRFGFTPKKIYALACRAFAGEYEGVVVKKWLGVFYKRFFTQQFKRNCMPDGVKTGAVCLNPRAMWRMPSDACARLWLDEVEKL